MILLTKGVSTSHNNHHPPIPILYKPQLINKHISHKTDQIYWKVAHWRPYAYPRPSWLPLLFDKHSLYSHNLFYLNRATPFIVSEKSQQQINQHIPRHHNGHQSSSQLGYSYQFWTCQTPHRLPSQRQDQSSEKKESFPEEKIDNTVNKAHTT